MNRVLKNLERLPQPILLLGVPLAFFAIAQWIMPLGEVLQFDPDEGIELAKVTLYNQGYRLYDQIWNDQPPLLTMALAGWLQLFGAHIVAARLLILGFATLLVGSFHGLLRCNGTTQTALAGTLALTLTLGFLRFSVSVMRGLPALSLAVFALYLLVLTTPADRSMAHPHPTEQQTPQKVWRGLGLLASGVCFGLALQIKLYVLLLLPTFGVNLLLGSSFQDWRQPALRQRLPQTVMWSVACLVTAIAIGLLSHAWDGQQLLGNHFNETTQAVLQREPSWLILLMFLVQDIDYSVLAGLSMWTLWQQRPPWSLLPVVWLGTVFLVLSFHKPLWDHYYPLLTVPVVWLATYSLPSVLEGCRPRQWLRQLRPSWPLRSTLKGWVTGWVLVAITLVPLKLTLLGVLNAHLVAESHRQAPLIQAVQTFAPKTHWLFTDLPIAAFYAHLKVPPELAVFSNKRIQTGDLSTANLLRILQTYQPEQVLLGRYPQVEQALTPYLQQHYVKHFTKDKITQYLHKSVL